MLKLQSEVQVIVSLRTNHIIQPSTSGGEQKVNIKFRKEDGSGLILALMTLMVLSVLGLALAATTLGGYRSGSINRDMTSAYYVAEAGANQIYQEITTFVNGAYESNATAGDFFKAIENSEFMKEKSIIHFDNQFGDIPKAEVQMTINGGEGNTKSYSLVSKGSVNDRVRLVEKHFDVTWIDKGEDGNVPDLPQDAAAIIRNRLEIFGGGEIMGNIYFDSLSQKSILINNGGRITNGTLYYNPDINFMPRNLFSEGQHYNQQSTYSIDWESLNNEIKERIDYGKENYAKLDKDLGTDQRNRLVLDKDYYRKNFEVRANNQVIDIGNNDVNLVVDTMKFYWGNRLDIQGEGTLNLYVKDEIQFESSGWQINMDNPNANLNIMILNTENKPISIMNNNQFQALIITPQSTVTASNHNALRGGIIANGLIVRDGGRLTGLSHNFPEIYRNGDNKEGTADGEIIISTPVAEPR